MTYTKIEKPVFLSDVSLENYGIDDAIAWVQLRWEVFTGWVQTPTGQAIAWIATVTGGAAGIAGLIIVIVS
jgi:hypothetical protein